MTPPSLNATTNTLRAIRNAIRNGRIPDADDQVEAMDRAIGFLDAQATAQPIGYQRKHPTEGWLTVRDEDRDYYRNQGQEIRAVYAIGKPAPDAPANEPSEKPAPAVIDSVISLLGELHTALAYNNVGNGRAKLREAIKILRDGFISVSRVSNDPVKRFSTSAIMWALDGCGLKPTPDGEWVRYSDHVAALAAQRATPPAEPVVEAQIEHMVQRFLQWKLPESFNPDCGISFDKSYRSPHGPVGTNLFDATQADAMVRHMLEGLPALAAKPAVKDDETVVEALRGLVKLRKDIVSDVSSAHQLRGNGASEWMREDDRDFRRELTAAFDAAEAALAAKDGRS